MDLWFKGLLLGFDFLDYKSQFSTQVHPFIPIMPYRDHTGRNKAALHRVYRSTIRCAKEKVYGILLCNPYFLHTALRQSIESFLSRPNAPYPTHLNIYITYIGNSVCRRGKSFPLNQCYSKITSKQKSIHCTLTK